MVRVRFRRGAVRYGSVNYDRGKPRLHTAHEEEGEKEQERDRQPAANTQCRLGYVQCRCRNVLRDLMVCTEPISQSGEPRSGETRHRAGDSGSRFRGRNIYA